MSENNARELKNSPRMPGLLRQDEKTASTPPSPPPGGEKPAGKKRFLSSPRALAIRKSEWLNLLFCLLVPLVTMVTMEWIARGTLGPHERDYGFFLAVQTNFLSFLVSYLLLVFVYIFVAHLVGSHMVATMCLGLLGNVPAVATYYKLTMRGEPLLPWDLQQIGDLMGVSDEIKLVIQPSMIATIAIFAVLAAAAFFVILPKKKDGKTDWKSRFILSAVSLLGAGLLLFGVFLSPRGTAAIGVQSDMWMQDRYYRTNGLVTGFLTNLQVMSIAEPEGYSPEAVQEILGEVQAGKGGENPLLVGAPLADLSGQQPDIIYVMAESFWDVTALPGVSYDRDLLPNLTALAQEGARGMAYTPSFGGGTCDVEFEALTGFSVDFLPSGSKPYQQYVTGETFSLPQELKKEGYETLAIHGYGRRFWNRDTAYPRLGIDTFIAQEDFVNPDLRRGFVSDKAMVDRIIEEHQSRSSEENPVFIHAVTMQNHTTYDRSRYPEGELVRVTESPAGIPDSTIGQLEDCATGIYEMDAALGRLTDYLRTVEKPTILVFWGDHMNPMSDGFKMFEDTGFIGRGETASPSLYQTPLLIWSNQGGEATQLGTVATYNLSPVVMNLFGLEKPKYFDFLSQQMGVLRASNKGYVVNPDGSIIENSLSPEKRESLNRHWMLQYDALFGENYQNQSAP